MSKYNFTIPKINLQELRLNIKIICKMVNIDEHKTFDYKMDLLHNAYIIFPKSKDKI